MNSLKRTGANGATAAGDSASEADVHGTDGEASKSVRAKLSSGAGDEVSNLVSASTSLMAWSVKRMEAQMRAHAIGIPSNGQSATMEAPTETKEVSSETRRYVQGAADDAYTDDGSIVRHPSPPDDRRKEASDGGPSTSKGKEPEYSQANDNYERAGSSANDAWYSKAQAPNIFPK